MRSTRWRLPPRRQTRMQPGRKRWAAPAALIVLGAGLMAVGIWSGEAAVVLQKAARICLECIGVG